MKVFIIGNSAAALSAIENFRKFDKSSEINVITKEGGVAYSRVLLPYVLRKKLKHSDLFIRSEAYYKEMNVNLIDGEVSELITGSKIIKLSNGTEYQYDKLLIATGSNAVNPPIEGINDEGIHHLWTKTDVEALIEKCGAGKKIVVIGSGFVSLQGAFAAATLGMDVTVVELMNRIMPNVLDDKGAGILMDKIADYKVKVMTSTVTKKIVKLEDNSYDIYLDGGEILHADVIIVGTGVRPNVQFINRDEVTIDRGIVVNEYMETNAPDVYSAGDVAQGPTAFGEVMIHALWPTAVEMGKYAGINMAGVKLAYEGSLNMNVTQMYGVTVASMGKFTDAEVETSFTFPEESGCGYLKVCFKGDCAIGACLVGSSDSVKLFGKLRPLIRKKIVVPHDATKLEMFLQMEAFSSKKDERIK